MFNIPILDTLGTSLIESFSNNVPNLLSALVVIVLFLVFYLVTSRVLQTALKKTKLQPSLQRIVVRSVYRWVISVFAIVTALSQLGIDITAALAGIGIAGIAIGLAAKETIANILAGFSIFVDKLYQNGDWIEVVGKYGQVQDITLRTTKIRTLENIYIFIPNSEITMNPVTNFSEQGMVRVSTQVSISYNDSIARAREVLLNAVAGIDGVREDPAPQVVVDKLDDSGVNLLVRIWVDDAGSDPKYRFELNELCKNTLDEAGLTIPFPQRDVHHYNP